MSKDCLVLNASYIPIETISWQDAFTKIFNGRAYAIEYYDDEVIHTPSDEFLKPAVIVCVEYNKIPYRSIVFSKRMVYKRDNYTCQYCRKQLDGVNMTLDHILPKSKGGRSSFENTVCCCEPCNAFKANRTLKEAKMSLICKPKVPKMSPIRAKFSNIHILDEWKTYIEKYVG